MQVSNLALNSLPRKYNGGYIMICELCDKPFKRKYDLAPVCSPCVNEILQELDNPELEVNYEPIESQPILRQEAEATV